jgi:CheY-like chemotaxis protein
VLVVEDDPHVRAVAVRTLREAGYEVIEASNGTEALALATDRLDAIDLVVTDVVMPQMGGRELAERLHARRRSLKVLFTSGYTENGIVHGGVLEEGLSFLQKPYDRVELARRVRELLDRPAH